MTLLVPAVLFIVGSLPTVGDLESSFNQLQDAGSKHNAALVKKLAVETYTLAKAIEGVAEPEQQEERDIWRKNIAYAREVELHTEYTLFNTAVQGPAAATVDLLATLERQNPKSKYLADVYGHYVLALTQTGNATKVRPVAEAAIVHFPNNHDLLLVLANDAMNRKLTDRGLLYSERLITVLTSRPVPPGMSPAEWQRKRDAALCRAHWIAGVMHSTKTQYYEADKDLRLALPMISGDESMRATALFHLGVVNYQLASGLRSKGKMLEAAKFSEQAAAIKGPLSYEAWRNAQIMKTEANKLR